MPQMRQLGPRCDQTATGLMGCQPTECAMPTAASCEETSSLARMDFTWVRTVASETTLIAAIRSEEHTSELQSLMRISYAVFCLKKKNTNKKHNKQEYTP